MPNIVRELIRRLLCRLRGAPEGGLPEVFELKESVRAALRRHEMREPIYVAVRVLSFHGLEEELATALESARGGWLGALVALLELGEKHGVWKLDELDGAPDGDLGMVRRALDGDGGHTVLAVALVRHAQARGRASYDAAVGLARSWVEAQAREGAPTVSKGAAAAVPTAVATAGTVASAPAGELVLLNAQVAREEATGSEPLSTSSSSPSVAGVVRKEELLALNVNQYTGNRITTGWFEPGKHLFLQRGKLSPGMLSKLEDLGLLLAEWDGKPAGPGLLFSIKAGAKPFRSIVAVDLAKLAAAVGSGWNDVAAAWGSAPSKYDVTEVVGMGLAEKAATPEEAGEPTELPCVRCGKPMLRKQRDGVYFVCSVSECGFSVDAGDDGAPVPPEPCRDCGGARYQNKQKGRVTYKHLHPCKRAEVAA